jgi:hypothetical protein
MRAWLLAAVAVLAPAAHAAHVTDVADAADEKHPLEVDLEATYTHLRAQTKIAREQTTAGGIQLNDELQHVRTLDALELRLAVGLWHDLELHVLAPLVLRDVQDWRAASGTSTLSADRISVSGCAAPGSCSTVQPIVPIPGQSRRVGFLDPTVGIAWGPINEERELKLKPELFPEGKPVSTWVLGFDYTLPLPGGKVDDPSRFGLNSGGGAPAPSAGPESRRAHVLTLWTAFSKRYQVLEPYLAMSGSAPLAAKNAYDNCAHPELLADIAASNCAGPWKGLAGYKPAFEGQLTLGAELVVAEDKHEDQRFSFDLRGDLRWHGPSRGYSQATDALGKLTYSDEYVTTTGSLGIYGRLARWFHLRVQGTLGVDSAHFLTHEEVGDDKDGDGLITISQGSGLKPPNQYPDQNPTYDFRVDQVGRRLRAEPALIWGVSGTLSLNF